MKLKLYIVWSVALCLALRVPQFAQASPPPPPIVEWTPRVLQHSLQAGQSILMRITATAPLDLYRAVVVPSLSLAPFIYIEPPGPRKFVRKGGKIIRNIRITMPSNISGANIQGLVRLSAALTSSGPAQIRRGALVISLPGWKSGVRNNSYTLGFASWRGQSNGVVIGWIDWKNGWAGMYTYASGFSPRQIRAKSSNVSFGHGLFPLGGILAACAAGEYDDEQRQVASRLVANGVGDAEIRLGWEASGDWFPWSAAGKPPEQWKACFTHVAKAMKSAAPNLRIGWFQAKKGRIDVRTIYPDDAPITNIGVSHYDDAEARFGYETYKGGPWGLRAWVAFARSKGKKFAIGEWGVGRVGDRPLYIQQMHDFLQENSADIAHEAYFNTSKYQLYPVGPNPKSSELYHQLF